MKRLICFLLLLLTAAMLFSLAACSPDEPTPDELPPEPPVPMIDIATDGQSLYRVVRGEMYTKDSVEVTCAIRVMKAMGDILGSMPAIVADWED